MKYSDNDTRAIKIIKDKTLTVNQQFIDLHKVGENTCDFIELDQDYIDAINDNIICDLNEGKTPFRPRYIMPDYELFFKKGSEFLQLDIPKNLQEACTYLLIFYANSPSVTMYPVYLGNLDSLLEPFYIDYQSSKDILRLFLLQIDKTLSNSFVHANIGPYDTKIGRVILDLTKEMNLAIPNITLLYDKDKTSDEFAQLCIDCSLYTSKPSFANDIMFKNDLGHYGIASCYNGFAIGGGAYSMNRLRLGAVGRKAKSIDDFFDNVLPFYVKILINNLDKRVKFLREEAAYFKSNFLVKESFLDPDKFVALLGIVGLGECCNILMGIDDKALGYGYNKEVDMLGVKILDKINILLKENKISYSKFTNGQVLLHAQVGIDTDGCDNSPGARIAIGYEPSIIEQIVHSTNYHKYFPTGVGDIYKFDETYINTPDAILDIIKGGFNKGMRYFSCYLDGGDVVRVTGYLVKRSEILKLKNGQQSINSATVLGKGAAELGSALDRRLNSK